MLKKQKPEKPRWKRNRTQTQQDSSAILESEIFSRAVFYFLLLAFCGACLYVFFFSPHLQIDKIEVVGNVELDSGEIAQVAGSHFEGKYLGFLPRNNYLLISSQGLEKKVSESFKRVRTVAVEKIFPNQLMIKIEERKSLLVWCSGEKCFLVDEKGYAYLDADFASREVQENHLVKIVEDDGKLIETGLQVMNEETAAYFPELKESFRQKAGLEIGEEFHVQSRLAEDVSARAGQGFDILVNFAIPAQRSAEIMKLFLDKQYKGGDLAKLAYVDLRVENKIFYKLKDQPAPEGEVAQGADKPEDKKEEKKDEKK